ncbi:MAG: SgcJ/EcaC family oxidoreductase [Actinomycetota bacterium]|nr:SgcJ/EcaC family oxidoreductase [Actinomycetota bacterium]
MTAIDIVRDFCTAWEKGDYEALLDFFTDDAIYHNIPVDPVQGKDAIRALITMFTASAERIEFRVKHIVADGDTVLTERLDVFVLPNTTIELPVMGTFELRDGKIAAWRDYFDLNQYMMQLQAAQ